MGRFVAVYDIAFNLLIIGRKKVSANPFRSDYKGNLNASERGR